MEMRLYHRIHTGLVCLPNIASIPVSVKVVWPLISFFTCNKIASTMEAAQ